MGRLGAEAMAEQDISLETAIGWHLGSNHYPPVAFMAETCITAITQINETGDWDKEIELPDGVEWKNSTTSPAWAIVENFHLEPWIETEEDL